MALLVNQLCDAHEGPLHWPDYSTHSGNQLTGQTIRSSVYRLMASFITPG